MNSPEFFKVEKDIKIPTACKGGRPSQLKQAFLVMQVGDSTLVPDKNMGGVWAMAKKIGIKICTRKADKGARRVWRMK